MASTLKFLLYILIYRILLDYVYASQITPFFAYTHLTSNPTFFSILISWILLLFLFTQALWAFKSENTSVSTYATILFFLMRIVPLTSFIQFVPQNLNFIFLNALFWTILFIGLRIIPERIFPNFNTKNGNYLLTISLASALVVLIVSGVYANFRIHFNFSDVYDLRSEARQFDMPLILKYLLPATANIIPISMVYFTITKRKTLVYFFAFIGLLNFSIAGQKSILFKIALCFTLIFIKKANLKKWVLPAFIFLCALSISEYTLANSTGLSNIVIRRVLYIPSLIDTAFYSFMKSNEPLYFNLFGSNSQDVSFAVGNMLYGQDFVRANNGLFSDAYANLGSIGCFILPLFIILFIKICDSLFFEKNDSIVLFTTLMIITTLGSSFFTTSLLTHGLLILCFTVALIPKQQYIYVIKAEKKNLNHSIT